MPDDRIRIRGAKQNNLKNIDVDLPLGELTVITGVSGSGKSSLAFDTVYAEGQRRYVETFSPYARQFLDRMDRPKVDRIDGIPPAIAIDQTNPVRTSRSTVGTMTELNDHLKLLFARAATLYCHGCGHSVTRDQPETVLGALNAAVADDTRVMITFPVKIPATFSQAEIEGFLHAQGYTHIHQRSGDLLEVVQDRTRLTSNNRGRVIEALEQAFKRGHGHLTVYPLDDARNAGQPMKYSTGLHCAHCDIDFQDPFPNSFSFNSPIGACETCRGFGRVIGIDWSLVVPDEAQSLFDGAVKPFQTDSAWEHQENLLAHARKRGVATDLPWRDLSASDRRWIIEGDGPKKRPSGWYGIQGFFDYLESKAYKMHVRVLLSKYRSYDACPDCAGARLKNESLNWRIGDRACAESVLDDAHRFRPRHITMSQAHWEALPGLSIHDLMCLPLDRCKQFFAQFVPSLALDQAADLLLKEIRVRLQYLQDVGLSYLTLDRQSRTLSGGEVQRINLTTALGTSLVNTLFVLDEPSIGLHSRDMQRVIGVLRRLRDAGNSLIVVEHDPEIMLAADRLIDMGPGPGAAGGRIIAQGAPDEILENAASRTAEYLTGRAAIGAAREIDPPDAETEYVTIRGAAEHNLRNLDVAFPLRRLVCVTGVSGSGKSTLIHDVLYNALTKLKAQPEQAPGAHTAIEGHELIDAVVLVDQSPIGKTSRANPASYVGALDGIRQRFAKEPLAKDRRYTAGTFSFNSGNGRCPTCGGTGFEHVEMQFLADVYLRCPDCDGKRFRASVLQVKYQGRSIADVLDLTVDEAVAVFADATDIVRSLEPLRAVGLGYVTLGQPVPTLSGGESQRLKLAGYLTPKKRRKGHTLFLFDEPTTGLHFADIAVLLQAFERLLRAGHSVIVIEHNLDLLRIADWIIDLGPGGGEQGGRLVCTGTPAQVKDHPGSRTGQALSDYEAQLTALRQRRGRDQRHTLPSPEKRREPDNTIEILHAREHNLKNISVSIPREKFTVVTGVSGSGKSTLAFDIVFNEGQRRYLESLNAYARQFVQPAARPDVDAVFGIPPTVAIEQRTSRGGHKSTVGTLTEIHHFLRLLFVKLGIQYCPDCEIPIQPQTRDEIADRVLDEWADRNVVVLAPLIIARKGIYNELAKWASRKGFMLLRADGEYLPVNEWPGLDRYQEHNIDLPVGECEVSADNEQSLRTLLQRALDQGKGTIRIADARTHAEKHYSTHRACPGCGKSLEEPDPRLFSYNSKHGWCPACLGTGVQIPDFDAAQTGEEASWTKRQVSIAEQHQTCPACCGYRLNTEALSVYFSDWSIGDYSTCSVDQAIDVFRDLELSDREASIGRAVIDEIIARLLFLQEVGLGYLNLDRAAPTLSGGEAQRIRLAAQLGSNLRGVCYVLDEPTIGLHARDNKMLLRTLHKLENKGNTIIVVEHDEESIRSAEHLIDLGPGAGTRGGRVVVQGDIGALISSPDSATGRALASPLQHPIRGERRPVAPGDALMIRRAALNNLQQVDVSVPLQRLVCVTGVSGSGKSSLIRDVLYENLKAALAATVRPRGRRKHLWQGCASIDGWQSLGRVLEVDQTPIGKTPRSCPATYIGIWDAIRKLFAATAEANLRGYTPGRFSFNTQGGRCAACEGQGYRRIEMSFLPDVQVPCDVCAGQRFNRETLEIEFKRKSIGEVLKLAVDEAVDFFNAHPSIHHALALLQDVGLGYLTLGQHSPTLSGGEAQRIKLVAELAKAKPTTHPSRRARSTLYLLDEPTVGLHMTDVAKLVLVLHRLVDAGHSVIVIEHNLDVVAEADWIVDLGPDGGAGGGQVMLEGTPESFIESAACSPTATALADFLNRRH